MKDQHENKMLDMTNISSKGQKLVRICSNCAEILPGLLAGQQICTKCDWIYYNGKLIKKGCGCGRKK